LKIIPKGQTHSPILLSKNNALSHSLEDSSCSKAIFLGGENPFHFFTNGGMKKVERFKRLKLAD